MGNNDFVQMAKDFGFTNVVALDVTTLEFLDEVRDMCSSDTCRQYDRNWTCPPACGTIEECQQKAETYGKGIIVQTTGTLDDPFDYERMMELQDVHQKKMLEFSRKLKGNGQDILPLGAGACTLCSECTYPNAPCANPEDAMVSMEAYGIFVSDLCSKNNIAYNYGEGTLTYVGLYLIN